MFGDFGHGSDFGSFDIGLMPDVAYARRGYSSESFTFDVHNILEILAAFPQYKELEPESPPEFPSEDTDEALAKYKADSLAYRKRVQNAPPPPINHRAVYLLQVIQGLQAKTESDTLKTVFRTLITKAPSPFPTDIAALFQAELKKAFGQHNEPPETEPTTQLPSGAMG